MSELQGAIGLAQLKKFNKIFERHEKNKNLILSKLKSFDNFKIRETPKYCKEASESLILIMKSNNDAKKFRKMLLKKLFYKNIT